MSSALVLCDGARPPAEWANSAWSVVDFHADGPDHTYVCRLDDIDSSTRRLRARADDLVRLASYAFLADTEVKRGPDTDVYGNEWRRSFRLVVPVSSPDFWGAANVQEALVEALSFASGDIWDFHFVADTRLESVNSQRAMDLHIDDPDRPDQVLLFSGGADSLAAAVREARAGRKPVLVSHRSGSPFNAKQTVLRHGLSERFAWRFPHLSAEIHRSRTQARETTQRTRGFLFASLGAAVAGTMGIDDVVLADNGVVSLNLPINKQLLGTLATRSTHPAFISRFNRLVNLVFPRVHVRNSLADATRVEALQELVAGGVEPLLFDTRSCAHPMGRSSEQPHCGVCSQCIDRRLAVLSADLDSFDPAHTYEVDILTDDLPEGEARTIAVSYVSFARTVQRLTPDELWEEFPQLFDALVPEDPAPGARATEISELLNRHGRSVVHALERGFQMHALELAYGSLPAHSLLRLCGDAPATGVQRTPESHPGNVMHRRGQIWQVSFEGESGPLQHRAGVLDIATIIKSQGQPVRATDLYRRVDPTSTVSEAASIQSGLTVVSGDDQSPRPDAEAQRQYKERVRELEEDLQEARVRGDDDRVESIRAEMDLLATEIEAGSALGRRRQSVAEQSARKAVSKRISDALHVIEGTHPALARHLAEVGTLNRGRLLSYTPPVRREWDVNLGT